MIKTEEECSAEFDNGKVRCELHGYVSYPSRYNEIKDSICYSCGGMTGDLNVQVNNLPDNVLSNIYRKVSKTNNSIRRNGGEPRNTSLISRLSKELRNRRIDIPETSLTHKVIMQKDQAMDSDVPAVVKIGEAVGDYEFGTLPEEMVWSVLVTEDEADQLNSNYSDVKVQKVTINTKS